MTAPDAPPERRNRLRPLALLLAAGVLAGSAVAAWVWWLYSGSLPDLEGSRTVRGLSAPVRIERDARGVPTLHADNRADLAFATGFVHGQDRFFQMDLLRRHPAGEMAALLGPALVETDLHMRPHRFRWRARAAVERMSPAEREVLAAYAAGVEQGRGSLRARPWEYLLLRTEPEPWREEDTVLVVFAMYAMLQEGNVARENAQGHLEAHLPAPLAHFLSPAGSVWDAPLVGPALPWTPIPAADAIDLRKDEARWQAPPAPKKVRTMPPGSNNWAVDARHTAHGGAIVACDMHLHLMAPGIWYRAALHWQGYRVVGATLPGAPAVVVGSNGRIAWGFTNVEADTSDQVIVTPDPSDPRKYLAPGGPLPFEEVTEVIRVKGDRDILCTTDQTVWGPIISDHRGDRTADRVALRWVAHEPGAVNLGLLALETAGSVEEALTIGPRCGSPAQNLVVADRKGHIGWTVMGRLPNRFGFDGRVASSWADGKRGWDGFLPARLHPRLIDPPTGRLWTANNRTVPPPEVARLGTGTYDHGARAMQIRDRLMGLKKAREQDMLALQLDDRAVFLSRWHELMLEVLATDQARADERRAALRREVLDWGGRAEVASVGYRLVRRFRQEVMDAVLRSLTAPCLRASATFTYHHLDANVDQSVWLLATQKPAHLLPPGHGAWEALLLACVDRVADSVKGQGAFADRLRSHTWGAANRAKIGHPLAVGVGPLARWMHLNMPPDPLPGDSRGVIRAQSPSEGASQRMAVSPGREEEGYFHMPAGQSGHPLSPHFRDGHEDWVEGKATPFLPGPAVKVLELRPGG